MGMPMIIGRQPSAVFCDWWRWTPKKEEPSYSFSCTSWQLAAIKAVMMTTMKNANLPNNVGSNGDNDKTQFLLSSDDSTNNDNRLLLAVVDDDDEDVADNHNNNNNLLEAVARQFEHCAFSSPSASFHFPLRVRGLSDRDVAAALTQTLMVSSGGGEEEQTERVVEAGVDEDTVPLLEILILRNRDAVTKLWERKSGKSQRRRRNRRRILVLCPRWLFNSPSLFSLDRDVLGTAYCCRVKLELFGATNDYKCPVTTEVVDAVLQSLIRPDGGGGEVPSPDVRFHPQKHPTNFSLLVAKAREQNRQAALCESLSSSSPSSSRRNSILASLIVRLDPGGLGHMNLSNMNLSYADLRGAVLFDTVLTGANLSHAWLSGVEFVGGGSTTARSADFTGADFGVLGVPLYKAHARGVVACFSTMIMTRSGAALVLVTACKDGSIKAWRVDGRDNSNSSSSSLVEVASTRRHGNAIVAMCKDDADINNNSNDNNTIVFHTASLDGTLRTWRLCDGDDAGDNNNDAVAIHEVRRVQLPGDDKKECIQHIRWISFSSDCFHITLSSSNVVHVAATSTTQSSPTLSPSPLQQKWHIVCAAFECHYHSSTSTALLFFGCSDGAIRVKTKKNSDVEMETISTSSTPLSLSYASSRSWLAVAFDHCICILHIVTPETATATVVYSFPTSSHITSLCFLSSDASMLLIGHDDGTLETRATRLWRDDDDDDSIFINNDRRHIVCDGGTVVIVPLPSTSSSDNDSNVVSLWQRGDADNDHNKSTNSNVRKITSYTSMTDAIILSAAVVYPFVVIATKSRCVAFSSTKQGQQQPEQVLIESFASDGQDEDLDVHLHSISAVSSSVVLHCATNRTIWSFTFDNNNNNNNHSNPLSHFTLLRKVALSSSHSLLSPKMLLFSTSPSSSSSIVGVFDDGLLGKITQNNTNNNVELKHSTYAHDGEITCIASGERIGIRNNSNDDNFIIATCGTDSCIVLWDYATLTPQSSPPLEVDGHEAERVGFLSSSSSSILLLVSLNDAGDDVVVWGRKSTSAASARYAFCPLQRFSPFATIVRRMTMDNSNNNDNSVLFMSHNNKLSLFCSGDESLRTFSIADTTSGHSQPSLLRLESVSRINQHQYLSCCYGCGVESQQKGRTIVASTSSLLVASEATKMLLQYGSFSNSDATVMVE
eukprot:PhM_4_TR4301/c0_g2_i1/m.25658